MKILFTNASHIVSAGQVIAGIAQQAQTLRIACGRVWLTVEGTLQDYWLSAGESVVVEPGRLVVIEADRMQSCIEIAPVQTVCTA
jgi:hypothetical protein